MLGNYFSFLGYDFRNYYIRYVAKFLVAYGFFLVLLFLFDGLVFSCLHIILLQYLNVQLKILLTRAVWIWAV